ncbi:MAG: hypothetical protein BGO63_00150 [Candidatus Accumulibacter sp. 66-26]|nr:ShlB/FhaC/HecB family hemolysin secretion/activation protein [Accumulibacter sp.]OJW47617.1 MAG: hypothetical protein BGO63_00150 [Candidatus Accumulibacter sp. 66-26]
MGYRRWQGVFLTVGCALFPAASAFAQAPSPLSPVEVGDRMAQELLRQQERERALRQQQEALPEVRLERPTEELLQRLPKDETPCFPIRTIELNGNDAEKFQWALQAADPMDDPASGQCLGGAGINLVMKRVQNAIVERGFVTTRILAEPQDLKSGSLRLTVIPGRVREVRFTEGSSERGTKWNAIPVGPGELLNLRDMEQGLENFKRVPTAEADIQIAPAEGEGATPGESDLVIQYRQAFPFRLTLSLDDGGSKATGKQQGGVTFSYDNFLTLNDLFYISVNQSVAGGSNGEKGTRGHTIHYSIPFGYWSLGLTSSSSQYHQTVAGINQSYVYSGTSNNSEVRLSRLIYRDGTRKTTSWLRGWTRSSNNYIDDTEIEVQRRRMAGWELGVGHREFLSSVTLDMNLAYRRGTGAMESLPAPEEKFGEGTSRPGVVTADAQVNWPFAVGEQKLRYTGSWRGQWNETPLVPQDRFAIGGRYTVRGFDGETVLSAERGWLIRNDLSVALGGSGQEFYLGADYGEVGGPSSDFLVGKALAGAVLGLRGGYRGFSYDVFIGQPLKRPEHFKTERATAGFSLNFQL